MITRRSAMGGFAAAYAALSVSPLVAAQKRVRPPRLQAGDKVALVAPASAVSAAEIERAQHWVSSMGLVPQFGANAEAKFGYLAGTDAQRAADLDAAFADQSIRAIFAIRGGYGAARILPLLDWPTIRANPKLFIGYSDNTALHLAIARDAGFATLHAPNAASPWSEAASWESLWRLAFTGEMPTLDLAADRVLKPGRGEGRLLGGNLTILSTLMGTGRLPEMEGAVLFLEDVNEEPYRIDRMLQQLKLAGVLDKAAGVIFGRCRACSVDDPEGESFTLDDVLDQHLGTLDCPVVTGANIGHIRGQLCLPHGAQVAFDADAGTLTPLEAVTV
ncbi:S66 peptidase family protein [Qipengyuania seohaensis]|uniref:S66 peptidase family protein n=1 Tax=Qipengyuania seohaensis TaxID=266951 RepID=UPI000C22D6E8|nr:LD-carboxypeptidase [Qipengyuania seohaensis]